MSALRPLVAVLAVALIALLLGSNLAGTPFGAMAGGAPAALPPMGPTPSGFPGSGPAPLRAAATPSVTPTCNGGGSSENYNPIGGVVPIWPFYPTPANQVPCTLSGLLITSTFNDEVHATFSSDAPGSASRFLVPIVLPNPAQVAESGFVSDFYVGLVVKGDNASVDNQSYFRVVFTPEAATNGSPVYNVTASVLSNYLYTTSCPDPNGLTYTWNNSYACIGDDLGAGAGTKMGSQIPAGHALTVTFNGGNVGGIEVYVNDTIQKIFDSSFTLSKAAAGHSLVPAYVDSCADSCYLNWSMPFGLGVGLDINTNTYTVAIQQMSNPIGIGSPEYYIAGSGYTGDYTFFSPESASGGCYGGSNEIQCGTVQAGTQYPFFQFNGTILNFGSSSDYNWTTQDFGGILQFSTSGTQDDIVPMFVDEMRNSTYVGDISSNTAVTVNVRADDLGTIEWVNLSYTLPDGTMGSAPMSRLSGTSSIGTYQGTIPSSGGDGTIIYHITAVNHAGQTVRLPATPTQSYSVLRGTLPRLSITVNTNPPGCGGIFINGIEYAAHQTASGLLPGYYNISAAVCYPYVFKSFTSIGAQFVPGGNTWVPPAIPWSNRANSPVAMLALSANATISGNWRYVRPFDQLTLQIATNNCGAIVFNGSTYSANTTVRVLDGGPYPIGYTSCGLNSFSGWVDSNPSNLTGLGGLLTLHGNGTLVLTYIPQSVAVGVVFLTKPASCGGVLFRGWGYPNATTVDVRASTPYPIGADPCRNWGLIGFNTTAGLTISGGTLTVTAPGTVTVSYYAETIVTIETLPADCGYVLFDSVAEYNGSMIIVVNGSSHVITGVPCAGHSFSGFAVIGPCFVGGAALIVEGSCTLIAVMQLGARTNFVAFITDPQGCGSITFGGRTYLGSNYTTVPLNYTTPLLATPCGGYGFVSWQVGGIGIVIVNGTAYVNGSGSIQANFHPLGVLIVSTVPAGCGAVVVAGQSYRGGTTATLPWPNTYTITAAPCAFMHFAYWGTSTGEAVANGTLFMYSQGQVTANFAPDVYDVLLDIRPANCGGIAVTTVRSANEYNNNTTLGVGHGSYNLTAVPCAGFHLSEWNVSGGLSVADNRSGATVLTVTGSGTVIGTYLPASPVLSLGVPTNAFVGLSVSFTARVATPVPPFTYTYSWAFGDGSTNTTTSNFTTHTYSTIGLYVVTLKIKDPYGRTAESNETISIVNAKGVSLSGISPIGYGVLAAAAVAVAAALLLARRPPSAPKSASPGAGLSLSSSSTRAPEPPAKEEENEP